MRACTWLLQSCLFRMGILFHVHRDHFVHDGSHYVYHPTPALSSSRSPLLQTPTTSTAAASTKEAPTGCEAITLTRYQDSDKYALFTKLNVKDRDNTGIMMQLPTDSIMIFRRPILRSCQFHVCSVPSIQDKDIEQRYKALFVAQTRVFA